MRFARFHSVLSKWQTERLTHREERLARGASRCTVVAFTLQSTRILHVLLHQKLINLTRKKRKCISISMYKNNIHIEVSFYTYKNALRGYLFDVSMSVCGVFVFVCMLRFSRHNFDRRFCCLLKQTSTLKKTRFRRIITVWVSVLLRPIAKSISLRFHCHSFLLKNVKQRD